MSSRLLAGPPCRPTPSPTGRPSTRRKRILTPLKRVDFDPDGGAEHPEPRRVRLRAHQLGRGPGHRRRRDSPAQAGAGAGGDPHLSGLSPSVGDPGVPHQRLLPLHEPGGLHLRGAQPRQLGRLALGRHAHVGLQPPARHPRAVRPPRGRAAEHRDDRLLVGRPGEHRRRHLHRLREHAPPLLVQGTGREDGLHRPLLQPHRRPVRRQVVRAPPGHRRGLRPGHRLHLAHRGHLRQGIRGVAHGRLRRVEGLRARQDRRRAQDARVGRGRERHPRPRDPGPGPGVGRQEDHAGRRRQGRLRRRLPLGHRQRVGPDHDRPGRHAGPGQARRQHLVDDAGRSLRHHLLVPRLQRGRHLRRPEHHERLPSRQPSVARRRASGQSPALDRRPDGLSPPASPRR